MDKIYYQPNHLWKGQKAVKKLKELSESIWTIKYPKIFQCDNGSKFKGDVTKMLEKNGVKIR